jgi:hypothetical protein
MMLSLFADAVVAVLLIATISYAAVLNRRLGILRGGRAQLEELVSGLTVATQRAEVAVGNLKTAATESGRQLEKGIADAQGLRDDLTYLLERAAPVADRLERVIRAQRDEQTPEARRRAEPPREGPAEVMELRPEARVRAESKTGPAAPPSEPRRRAAAPSRAERDLLRALLGMR